MVVILMASVGGRLSFLLTVSCTIFRVTSSNTFSMVDAVCMAAGLIIWGKTPCLIVAIAGFIVGLIYSLVINKAAIGRTQYNIDRFVNKHSICMNEDRWNAYVEK